MIEPGSRWTGYFLLASLALNIFVIGLIVTRMMTGASGTVPVEVKNTLTVAVQPTEPLLPPPARKLLIEAMDPHRKQVQAAFKRIGDSRHALAHALVSEPYDAKSVEKALEDMRAGQAEIQQTISAALLEAAPNMAPEERIKLAQMFQNPGQGWRQANPNAEQQRSFQLKTDP